MNPEVSFNPDLNRVLFFGFVKNNIDPNLLERVRVVPEHEKFLEIIGSYKDRRDSKGSLLNNNLDDIREDLFFTNDDPFVFFPFLPLNVNIIPSINDGVLIIYSNSIENVGRKRQFYIKSPISTITAMKAEDSNQTKGILGNLPNVKSGKPLRNVDGYFNTSTKGVMSEVEDVGIYSKGRSDIILKDTEIILRARKTKELKNNENPVVNKNRSFLQLSDFEFKTIKNPIKNVIKEEVVNQQIVKLVEYEIDYGFNEGTNGPYSGNINIYNLPGRNSKTTTTSFKSDTVLDDYTSFFPYFTHEFVNVHTVETVSYIVNSILKGLNSGEIDFEYVSIIDGQEQKVRVYQKILDNRFPFFYRPSMANQNLLNKGDANQRKTINALSSRVVFPQSRKENPGAGLISKKNYFGQLLKTSLQKISTFNKEITEQSYAVLGSDKVFLISRTSQIPDKPSIIVDDEDVYGISELKLATNYMEATEGMVRGESLKKLLSLMVRFLLNHQHLYNRYPPYETTTETAPITSQQVLEEFNLFDQKVINQNIRIN
jgi:hypothetical protein